MLNRIQKSKVDSVTSSRLVFDFNRDDRSRRGFHDHETHLTEIPTQALIFCQRINQFSREVQAGYLDKSKFHSIGNFYPLVLQLSPQFRRLLSK